MGDLTDIPNTYLKTDNNKKNGLLREHFGWRDDSRNVGEGAEIQQMGLYSGVAGITIEEMAELVRKALPRISNKTTSGLDGIRYKLIK